MKNLEIFNKEGDAYRYRHKFQMMIHDALPIHILDEYARGYG